MSEGVDKAADAVVATTPQVEGAVAAPRDHWALSAGLVVWGICIFWWLAYYGQYQGWFSLIDQKVACLALYTDECTTLRETIGRTWIPVYWPLLWYLGLMFAGFGVLSNLKNKAAQENG